MAHSYVSNLMHCTFSTKDRYPFIDSDLESRLWSYLGGIARENRMKAYSIIWGDLAAGNYVLTARAIDSLGRTSTSDEINVTVIGPFSGDINVARAANGGMATASSTYDNRFAPAGAIDGDRKGINWGNGGGWNDATADSYPDWLQVDFDGTKDIHEIDLFTVQDNYNSPSRPTPTMTFNQYGITDFILQYWNGSDWATVPGGQISGNNLIWRKITFATLATPSIRVLVNGSLQTYSRITEIEAYGVASSQNVAPPRMNVALASRGATVTASSVYSGSNGFPASAVNDGDRRGVNWGAGGGWNDDTAGAYPDWIQIDFNGSKTINEIDTFTLQDNYGSPIEPTEALTFTQYGITDFEVQYWNGSGWTAVPGGSVTGNDKVWRKFAFPEISTVIPQPRRQLQRRHPRRLPVQHRSDQV